MRFQHEVVDRPNLLADLLQRPARVLEQQAQNGDVLQVEIIFVFFHHLMINFHNYRRMRRNPETFSACTALAWGA